MAGAGGRGLGRWPGGWACGSQAGTLARAQRLPPLGSAQRPCPWPPRTASLPGQTPGLLSLGRWGSGPGTEGPSPEVSWPPWLSVPSQQGGEMGRPPGPHSTPAPEGTSAVTGLILDLISGLHCELWDPLGGVWGRRAQWGSCCPQRHLGSISTPTPRAPLGAHCSCCGCWCPHGFLPPLCHLLLLPPASPWSQEEAQGQRGHGPEQSPRHHHQRPPGEELGTGAPQCQAPGSAVPEGSSETSLGGSGWPRMVGGGGRAQPPAMVWSDQEQRQGGTSWPGSGGQR